MHPKSIFSLLRMPRQAQITTSSGACLGHLPLAKLAQDALFSRSSSRIYPFPSFTEGLGVPWRSRRARLFCQAEVKEKIKPGFLTPSFPVTCIPVVFNTSTLLKFLNTEPDISAVHPSSEIKYSLPVLASAGIEIVFFLGAGTVLCFRFWMRLLITH